MNFFQIFAFGISIAAFAALVYLYGTRTVTISLAIILTIVYLGIETTIELNRKEYKSSVKNFLLLFYLNFILFFYDLLSIVLFVPFIFLNTLGGIVSGFLLIFCLAITVIASIQIFQDSTLGITDLRSLKTFYYCFPIATVSAILFWITFRHGFSKATIWDKMYFQFMKKVLGFHSFLESKLEKRD